MTKPQASHKKGAPPSLYSDAFADAFCARIASGESLRGICSAPGMPHTSTILNWLSAYPAFSDKYARAREQQADIMDARILEVAEESTPETAASDRIKIDAFKWRASKLKPKVYGDRIDVAVSHALDLSDAINEARNRLANAAPALIDVTPNALPNDASNGDDSA